jgi:ferredoxin
MPSKYYIHPQPAPPRFEPVTKPATLETDGCLGCLQCAKRDCIYDVYDNPAFLPDQLVDGSARLCRLCMRCVQECRNRILTKALNPQFTQLGNDAWKPETLLSLWNQAETGKIPVSGSGYTGPFTGPGFDSMWTDMSEIVRPTRDGIHGREYISTLADIGEKPDRLAFDRGKVTTALPPVFSVPLPLFFDVPERARKHAAVREAFFRAAKRTGLSCISDDKNLVHDSAIYRYRPHEQVDARTPGPMIEVRYDSGSAGALHEAEERFSALVRQMPKTVVCAGLTLDKNTEAWVLALVRAGVHTFRLYADMNGLTAEGRFIKDAVRELHLALVQRALRDRVTLIAGGGIAMAEHMAKLIACGADAVAADDVLMVALECRMCGNCLSDRECPVDTGSIDPAWGARRINNLMASWHSQLIEVMGAMGLRELRRLRGETGRVMFFEDLERECFGPLFGKRIGERAQ